VIPRLHLVTDDAVLHNSNFVRTATELLLVLQRRVALHIRARALPARMMFEIASELTKRAETVGGMLIVNDRIDVALTARAQGVQLGARTLPIGVVRALSRDLVIGFSAHSVAESVEAEREGANYLFAGSIFPTASHPEAVAAGTGLLEECVAACRIPVLAIGGVTAERIGDVMRTGAYGVAVIRAVWNAPDPVHAAEQLAKLLES
jgi:thiamine-phosphate pyrophosphorylase